MKITKGYKIFLTIFSCIAIFLIASIFIWLKGVPYLVSNKKVLNFIENTVQKTTGAEFGIKNPSFTTELSPNSEFKAEKIYLYKESEKLLYLTDLDFAFSLGNIFKKNLIIHKFSIGSVYADINKIAELFPEDTKKEKKKESDFSLDVFDSIFKINNCEIVYFIQPNTKIYLKGNNIEVNNSEKEKRHLYFKISADILNKDKKVNIKLSDNNMVFFKDNHFHIEKCPLNINNSKIFINLNADRKRNYKLELFSNNFNVNDVIDFLNTQVIENTVQKDVLSYFSNIKGNIDFKLNIENGLLNGDFKLNNASFNVNNVDKVLVTLTKGRMKLTPEIVTIEDFKGYYDNNPKNRLDFSGTIKDYLKSIDADIVGNARVRNDFIQKHLSKISGIPLQMKGESPTKFILKSKNNIMDFVWLFMLKPNDNIKVADDFLPFENTLRLMKTDMHLENMILDIKSLDYHIVEQEELKRIKENKEKPKEKPNPIFRLRSSIDLNKNNRINYVSFEIPKPLPSEILNAVLKQKIFKKGKISGNITLNNKIDHFKLNGYLKMDKVIIPSHLLYIKEANLNAGKNLITLSFKGGYRRSKYSFKGDILNELKFPIIVKDINFSLENIDTYKVLESMNGQNTADNVIVTDNEVLKIDKSNKEFDVRNLIIEKGHFHLGKGTYKEIDFSNLDADLSLDKEGVIRISSNRFDFASGYSSLKATFDLINKKYNVKLGARDVDPDKIASALLELKKEITGKASGFLNIETDDTMQLNGHIKFKIKDGTIEKIGLVQYVLKCASLLRNTVSMISPATLADIITIPEGKFDDITGSIILKNNIATQIRIKTGSDRLSNYIAGRYDINNGDTSLRVYTKFSSGNKGLTGFLRKMSLGALANQIPMTSKTDLNYYMVELKELPKIKDGEEDAEIFLTRMEGDVANNNYISSLKKLK